MSNPPEQKSLERILVIRLGALGDLVLCFQAFHEIRKTHPAAEIALLTMPAFAGFARHMPWFNQVLADERAPAWRLDKWLDLFRQVRNFAPTRVYDLQGKFRQDILFFALGGPSGPEWSGAAPLCSHPRLWPPEDGMHYTDFVGAQLRRTDVPQQTFPDLSWLDASIDSFNLPSPYAVLIPGCAAGREYKRWPAVRYAELARKLEAKGMAVVAVGGGGDQEAIDAIRSKAPFVIDLSGKTDLLQLAGILRRSAAVIGNDTGPTHMAAALGAPTVALMSEQVTVTWSAPKGPQVKVLQGQPLAVLGEDKVFLALEALLDRSNQPVLPKEKT